MPRALVLFSAARPPADNEVRTLVLPHPRGGEPALFARSGNAPVALQRSNRDHGAWFVDDGLQLLASENGSRQEALVVSTVSSTNACPTQAAGWIATTIPNSADACAAANATTVEVACPHPPSPPPYT